MMNKNQHFTLLEEALGNIRGAITISRNEIVNLQILISPSHEEDKIEQIDQYIDTYSKMKQQI